MSDHGKEHLSDVRRELLDVLHRAGRTRIAEWRMSVRAGGERLDAYLLGLGGPDLIEERLLIAQSDDGGFVLTHCEEDLAERLAKRFGPKDADD